jgi:hypothetical protein
LIPLTNNTDHIKNGVYQLWMWSGAQGSTHKSGARGPGFDPTPNPGWHFLEAIISLLSDNRLKNNFINL